eukprot:TRINITY_DN9592_c0_g1_i1.p1 TRINITY_DN9592_c0_g1~~TRINITY_DN9592_c0_g1_i1.p1  ORF type:complete len:188 (+),score=30.21 TRINITY_DN9592_c0_g1_i1:513-1076(+)
MSTTEDDSTLKVLESRTSRLETLLASHHPAALEGHVAEKVHHLSQKISSIQSDYPEIEDFLKKYETLKVVLAGYKETFIDTDGKQTILLASEEHIKEMAKSLELIQENEKFINSAPMQDVPQLSAELDSIRRTHAAQLCSADAAVNDVDGLVRRYNNVVNLLSETFLHYDQILTAWEKAVGQYDLTF